MKLRLIALFSLLLIATVAAWAVSNSSLYQLPSVVATPICNQDLGRLGGVTGLHLRRRGLRHELHSERSLRGLHAKPCRHKNDTQRSLPHEDRHRQSERDLVR
jgi:hypothetical protein